MNFETTKALVRHILENATSIPSYRWTVQGFGFMRLYLGDGRFRLHVWDSSLMTPGVSTIHDHIQWHFKSLVISGELVNYRFLELSPEMPGARPYEGAMFKPGEGTERLESLGKVWLDRCNPEWYGPGDSYSQMNREIHETVPVDGTVTLIDRERTNEDRARIYWPWGTEWVSAEPRVASCPEIAHVTENALRGWVTCHR